MAVLLAVLGSQENIDGIIATATDLLHGESRREHAPMDKLFYADAKEHGDGLQGRTFPGSTSAEPTEDHGR